MIIATICINGLQTGYIKRGSNMSKITDECEYDCSYYCMGCDKIFHDIKDENGLDHGKEMAEYRRTVEGNYYCHIDCFLDSH